MGKAILSVIVPSFNRPRSTLAAVQSVLTQNVECEVIVVDDASDDPGALPAVLREHAHVRLVRRDANGGAGAARNTGLAHARSDLVSFLDSDDRLLPGTLAPRIEQALAIGFGSPEAPVIHACGWREAGGRNRRRFPRPSVAPRDFFSACWFAPGSALLARTDLFRCSGPGTGATPGRPPSGPFDERLRRLEDFDLFARLATDGLALVGQPVLGVELDAAYSAETSEIFKAADLLEAKFETLLTEGRIGHASARSVKAYLAYERAAAYARSGRKGRALAALAASLACKPRLTLFPGPGWDRAWQG